MSTLVEHLFDTDQATGRHRQFPARGRVRPQVVWRLAWSATRCATAGRVAGAALASRHEGGAAGPV